MTPIALVVFWFESAVLFLLPGLLACQAVPAFRALGFGERLLPATLLSVALLSAVYGIALAVLPTLQFALALWIAAVAAVLLLAIARRHAGKATSAPRPPGDRAALLLVTAVIGIAFVEMLRQGGSLGYVHDSLDFVAFVRRMVETGRIDLVSAAYADPAGMTPDPRRGAFHVGAALLCRTLRIPADEFWRAFPSFLVPLALWILFASGRRILQSARVAAVAVAFFAFATLVNDDHFLNNLAYASRLGWAFSWIGLWGAALWLDEEGRAGTPADRWSEPRLPAAPASRAGYLLAVWAAPALVGVHILSALQYLVSLAALAWGTALARREPPAIERRLALLPLLGAAALAPFLAAQLLRSYATSNPLFDHPQGLLYVVGSWPVLGLPPLLNWYGWLGLLAVLLAVPLARRFREHRRFAWMLSSTVATALVVLNPLAVAILEKVHAHSLLFRVMWVAPIFHILAWYAVWASERVTGALRGGRPPTVTRPNPARTFAAVGVLVLIGLAAAAQIRDAVRFRETPAARRAAYEESAPLRAALAELDRLFPEPITVASDPITSYQIPAYTRHFALTPLHQHSSPADDRAVQRIQDAMAILNPHVPLDRTVELLRRYGARAVVLNQSFPRYVRGYYTYLSPVTFPEQKEKLARRPDLFEPLYDREQVAIYRFVDPGGEVRDTLTTPPAERVASAAARSETPVELARALGYRSIPAPPVEGLEFLGVAEGEPRTVAPGDVLELTTYWRRTDAPMVLPAEFFVRAETPVSAWGYESPIFGKAARILYEARTHRTPRFGRYHQPLEVTFPPFLWEPGAVYRDVYELPIPGHVLPGEYTVRLLLYAIPYTPNFRMSDLLRNDDSLQGVPILEFRVSG